MTELESADIKIYYWRVDFPRKLVNTPMYFAIYCSSKIHFNGLAIENNSSAIILLIK